MTIAYKTALLSGLLAIAAPALRADGNYTVDQKLEKLSRELSLTDAQREDVRDILEDQKARKEAAQSDSEREAVKTETHNRIRGVLTDPQKEQYDRMKEDKMRKTPDSGKPAMPPDTSGD